MILFWVIIAAIILFSGLIFPIWALVDCLSSPTFTTSSKVIWGCILFLFWTPAGIVYGLVRTTSKAFKRASIVVLVIGIVGAFLNLFANQMLSRLTIQMNDLTVNQIRRAHLTGVSELERDEMINNIGILSNETRGLQIWQRAKRGQLQKLSELIRAYIADGELNQSEYQDWIQTYNARYTLSMPDLERHLKEAPTEMKKVAIVSGAGPIDVYIAKNGGLAVNQTTCNASTLEATLRSQAIGKQDPLVIIHIDMGVPYPDVENVMDTARKVGLSRITIQSNPQH